MIYYKFFNPEPIYYFCEIDYIHKTEVFKPVIGFDGVYEVSDLGRVKNLERKVRAKLGSFSNKRTRIIKPFPDKDGYLRLGIYNCGIKKRKMVHRLVLESFILNPKNKPEVNHINGIKNDNRLFNLEWNTSSENQLHAFRLGLQISKKGQDRTQSKLKNEDVLEIRKMSKEGFSGRYIAKKYNVAPSCICKIINRLQWKHI